MLKKALCVCLLFSMLFLSACADHTKDPTDTVKFTDALGRELSVSRNPVRVATLLGSFADVWMLSGGELCAAADDAWEDFGLPLENAVNIGGAHSPSLELLISADPEFVIASASTASNVALRDSLEAMGITVAYFEVDRFEDYLAMLDICTQITGRRDLYEKTGFA
jgi:iron complex transport system substrate-binding protein